LGVWLLITAFWLIVTAFSGYGAFWVPLLLAPVALVGLAHGVGLGRLPRLVVYPLGCAPVFLFPAVDWKWPIGLLILAMIWGYEQVLDAVVDLRKAARKADDHPLALLRVQRITLIWVSFDALAAGLGTLFLLLAIVAVVRMGRLSVVLTFAAFVLSLAAFLFNGDPTLFLGWNQPDFEAVADVDWWFTFETLAGAMLLWGRAAYLVWARPQAIGL
jgi:hypothetical protein